MASVYRNIHSQNSTLMKFGQLYTVNCEKKIALGFIKSLKTWLFTAIKPELMGNGLDMVPVGNAF